MLIPHYTPTASLIAGGMGVEPIPLLRWFQPSSPRAPAAVPSNLTSLHESFLLLSTQPAGGLALSNLLALLNKLLVLSPQANGTTQSVFVVDTIASFICGRHIQQCHSRLAIGEVDRIRTYGPRFHDQGISNPSHSTSLPLLQICFLCVSWAWNHHLSAAALNI